VVLEPADEIAALSLMRAALLDRRPAELSPGLQQAVEIVTRLKEARYVVLVHDAEPADEPRNPLRVEGLISLAQALNGPTRAALCSLRAGGNRVGAESVLTWQTGYPFGVNLARGIPEYAPGDRGLQSLGTGKFGAALVVGTPDFDKRALSKLGDTVVIGPRASQSPFQARVAIDTGVAGIHEGGTGYRMDEVPLGLRPPLTTRRPAVEMLRALGARLREGEKRP
jgi:formylmethanofuran dehydrogenase subunit B